ncbi:hypothetical protein ACU6VI_05145 [Sphaerotilus natans]|uniref:hypothetical protein n=1 Tax=Sphaerotilus natans TaxID=34103 RepID=UPI00406C14F3
MDMALYRVPGLSHDDADHCRRHGVNRYEAECLVSWASAAGCRVADLSRNEIRRVLAVTYNRKVERRDDLNALMDGLTVAYGAMQTAMRHETFEAAMKDPKFRECVKRRLYGPRFVGISTLCNDIADQFDLQKEGGDEA